jgi:hypothetical protein
VEEYGLSSGWSRVPVARCAGSSYTSRVAELESPPVSEETPPLDQGAVERAYRLHRARRAARAAHAREAHRAGLRFWLVLALVLLAAAFLAARTMGEVERIFGL